MTEKETKAIESKILKAVLSDFINSLHRDGIISTDDLSDKIKVTEKIKKYMAKHKDNLIFDIIIDHRETLLNVAEKESKDGHFELAVSLYATFVEHTLNRIIHLTCLLRKIDAKTQTEIIRNVNMIGKCSWLMVLLNLPAFRKEYVSTILMIAEERNSFMHYKWKPERDTDKVPEPEKKEKENQEKINKIKALLKYLKTYETRLEFRGKKRQINKAI